MKTTFAIATLTAGALGASLRAMQLAEGEKDSCSQELLLQNLQMFEDVLSKFINEDIHRLLPLLLNEAQKPNNKELCQDIVPEPKSESEPKID